MSLDLGLQGIRCRRELVIRLLEGAKELLPSNSHTHAVNDYSSWLLELEAAADGLLESATHML